MPQRNQTLDIAKGIGIITVVWGHTTQSCPILREIYLFHMPLFFLLSGYFFKDGDSGFQDVLKKRIQSYIFPYIAFFIIVISLFIALYCFTGRSELIKFNLGILFHPYGTVGPLWFLISLFEVHVGYYLLYHFIKKTRWISIICLFCLFISYWLSINNMDIPLYINSSLSMLLFFHIGYLFNKYSILKYPLQIKTIFLGLSILFYIIGILFHIVIDVKQNKIEGNLLLATCAALGGSYIVLCSSEYISKLGKIASALIKGLTYLGKNTLIIFALHILCFEIFKCLLGFPDTDQANYLNGLCMTILGISGSLIMGYPIKKYILPYLTFTKIKSNLFFSNKNK